ncbi:MAG TPA: PAS domain S-box protein [Syntrophales bacterium]|nr:PAS domain S-box protein [Syntrophales bacterium]
MKHRYILAAIIFTLGLSAYFFASFYNEAKQDAIKNVNNEQWIQAGHAARGIEDSFTGWTRLLTSISSAKSIIHFDKRAERSFEFLYKANQDKFRAITRLDAKGRIVYTYPFDSAVIGKDISGQTHVRELMATRKPVISDVFLALQGYRAIALHVPVFRNHAYDGSIGITINFEALAKRYLENIRVGNTGYAWVVSRDGTELYCPVPGHIGNSVFENCSDFPSILVMAEKMLKGEQGTTTYTFDKIRGSQVESVRKHAVYMPIRLGNTFWSIVVASSEDEIIASLESFRNKLFMVIGLLLLGGVLFSYYGFRAWFILEEEKKRHQTEEALRKSEENYRLLFESATEGILIAQDGMIKVANQALAEILKYPRDLLLEKPFPLFIHPDDRSTVLERHQRRLKGESPEIDYPFRIITSEGTENWVQIHPTVISWDGRPAVLSFVMDITEQKHAAERLRESQRRLADIIEFLPDATLVIDEEGRVIAWNRAIEAMTGVRKEDMLGKGNYEYAIPFYGERRRILIDLALHPDPEKEKEYLTIRRSGDIIQGDAFTPALPPGNIHVSGTASVLRDSEGKIVGAIECIRDDTDRKIMEERLQRAEKMESLGILAGGVAHDLNNVLGVLVGYSELLMREAPEGSRSANYAGSILAGGQRAAAIIQDLLTMARRGVSVSETVNLNLVLADAFKTPEFELVKAHHPDVLFESRMEKDLFNIKGSPVHLSKTIMNLLSNAAESIRGKGTVTVTTENRYVDLALPGYENTREGEYAVLTVTDTGSGIAQKDMGRIFEPFYTKKVMGRSGTGLGLAVVWGTVKDHGGYIDVQTAENQGTSFVLYFPVTREALSKTDHAPAEREYRGNGESILVVDDVKEQRLLAATILEGLDYRVAAVASGEEAVEYLRANQADLIILDMIMDPGIDGLETYRRILEIQPRQKAIIVSGFARTERVNQAQDLGAGEYVRKPYVIEKLGMAVRRELDRL